MRFTLRKAFLRCSLLLATPPSIAFPTTVSQRAVSDVLFPYQKEGVKRLVESKNLLLADEMGLGKTVQVIEALNQIGNKNSKALVICPKSLLNVWEYECSKWLQLPLNVQVVSPQNLPEIQDGSITVINYDIVHKYKKDLRSQSFDFLICDEAHYLKNIDARRTEAVLGDGIDLSRIPSDYLWLLTGTPVLNRPIELYPLVSAIDPLEFGVFEDFVNRYCDPQIKNYGGNFMRDFSGASNLPELSRRLKPLMLRRYKMDVLKQLPPKFRSCKCLLDSGEASLERMRINELLNMKGVPSNISSNESLRVEDFGYEASSLVKYLGYEVDMDDPESKNKVMGLIATVRKETALLKVDVAADMLKDAILSEKIVAFAHHRDVIESLSQKFGKKAVCVYGGMKTEDRANAVRRFQEDPACRLFIGSIRAAGVGLTLTASSHVIFLETDWSPGIMNQAEDRCHRVGQNVSVQVEYYVFRNTIDEWVAKALINKQSNINQILPGDEESTTLEVRAPSKYVFDFGKHCALRLEDVPPSYIQYLIKKGIYKDKFDLWKALFDRNMVAEEPLKMSIQQEKPTQIVPSEIKKKVLYKFDFGKYNGQMWNEVPESYRTWIMKEQVWKSRGTLKRALINADYFDQDPDLGENNDSSTGQTNDSASRFPIKKFRLSVQSPYLVQELEVRGIEVPENDKTKILTLKRMLKAWYDDNCADDRSGEITLLHVNPSDLWRVTRSKNQKMGSE